MLVKPNDEVISVVPIVGMGGLGKTSLARSIFKDKQIIQHFNERIWICVSKNFDTTKLLKRILKILTKGDVQVEYQEDILQDLRKKLADGRYLLVLDDLWNDKYWESFKRALLGVNSKRENFIIVTTRSKEVASIIAPTYQYSLNTLSDSDCLDIIKKRAFSQGDEVSVDLEPILRKIACKCGGLPLAANIIGGTLQRIGKDEWGSVSESELLDSSEDAIGVLKVSVDRLPSSMLKKCFAYCSILRKDVEIEKERLIQLWTAEGLLAESDNKDMESLGSRVYDTLLQNFFFQEEVKDEYGNIKHSKMHDLLHDLACLISTAETFIMENPKTDCPGDQVKYVVMKSHVDQEPLEINENLVVNLRALVLGSKVHGDLLNDCKYLRILDLQQTDIEELTTSIAKLIHLRFLDVSFTKIRAFPDSICKLYNLQTLRAIRCNSLKELPRQLQNLLSLRHFIVENAFFTAFQMPREIGKLTHLRTLKFFNVGQENGRGIKELENLKLLKGELEIRNLEHVNDKRAAARACLVKKPNIHKLVLVWSEFREGNPLNDGQVLEGLAPHPNIKSLTIKRFFGKKFPQWIMNWSVGVVRRLDQLIELKLIDCESCEEIPTLGHLPRLKILEFVGLKNVKSIGMSFYYPDGWAASTKSGGSQLQALVLFGALEIFRLHNMPNLVEWTATSTNNATRVVNAFPRLESLDISKCPNLSSAPRHGFPSLKELRISDAEKGSVLLEKICGNINNLTSLTSLELCRVSDLTCLPTRLFHNVGGSLSSLKIMECPSLTYLQLSVGDHAYNATSLQHLERLYIIDCSNLKSIKYSRPGQSKSQDRGLISLRYLRILNCITLADVPSRMLESSTSLVYLMVSNCPQLTSFPVDFERMPHLYYLEISQCKNLSKIFPRVGSNCLCHLTHLTLDAWANHGSFEDFCRDFQGLLSLRSLEDLTLHGNRNWSSLPSQLQHLTALTRLSLSYFGVEELPEWFGNFSYLRTLSLHDMEFLRRLPRTMERLTELDDLYVNECEKLSRLWKGKYSYDGIYADPDFPMFSQVLCVHVNGHVAIVLDPEKRQAYTDEY